MMKAKLVKYLPLVAVITLQAGIFSYVALNRLIARDEGFYVLAAKNVVNGMKLYRDFFYPQMPLLPYLYGAWALPFGMNWYSARLFSAFLTTLIGAMIVIRLWQLLGRWYAVIGGLLFAGNVMILANFLTIKTYALSTAALFAAYLILTARSNKKSLAPLLLAGIFFGLSITTRLFFAGLVPAFFFLFLAEGGGVKKLIRCLTCFAIGTLIGLLPNLPLVIEGWDLFYLNNLGYHLQRSDRPFAEDLAHKMVIMRVLLGLRDSIKFDAFQFPFLLAFSAFAMLVTCLKRVLPDPALYIAASLFILNFLPTPAYVQYFSVLVPFLLITSLDGVRFLSSLNHSFLRKTAFILLPVVFIIYFCHVPSDIDRYTRTGDGVIAIRNIQNARRWNLPIVLLISKKIEEFVEPHEQVISFWPGYLFEAKAQAYPGTENQFGRLIAPHLTPEERLRYRVIATQELPDHVRTGDARLVILDRKPGPRMVKALRQAGYQDVGRLGPGRFYLLPRKEP